MAEIYALIDPRTGAIRYVGKANDSAKRLKTHIRASRSRNTPVYCWMRKLADIGLVPSVRVLEVTDNWQEAERRLIDVLRARGELLLNVAEGGDEPYCSPEQRAENGRRTAASIHGDPFKRRIWEIKRAMAAALKEGYLSNERRAKLRLAAQKRPDLFGAWLNLPDRVE
jgi:hypothetical protein